MKAVPINNLDHCCCKNCNGTVVSLVQKTIGFQRVMYGYCQFHAIIAATLFPNQNNKITVSLGA